jgi:hypothetical protein
LERKNTTGDAWASLKEHIYKSKTVCKQWRQVHADPTGHLITEKSALLGELQGMGESSD